jgi:hypothetical protein
VFVVGGLGSSEYVFQQIKQHVPYELREKVIRPSDPIGAVVKGAVLAGTNKRRFNHTST